MRALVWTTTKPKKTTMHTFTLIDNYIILNLHCYYVMVPTTLVVVLATHDHKNNLRKKFIIQAKITYNN